MRTFSSISSARARAAALPTPLWRRTASAIWSPILKAGFSEVIGSWNTIAIRSPRISDIAAGESPRRSSPSKTARPETICAGGDGRSPIIANAVTLLPQPDSPTRHSVSPGPTENETSSTTLVRAAPNRIDRFSTEMIGAVACTRPAVDGFTSWFMRCSRAETRQAGFPAMPLYAPASPRRRPARDARRWRRRSPGVAGHKGW